MAWVLRQIKDPKFRKFRRIRILISRQKSPRYRKTNTKTVLGPLSRVHTHPETCRVALRDLSAVENRGFPSLLLPEYVPTDMHKIYTPNIDALAEGCAR